MLPATRTQLQAEMDASGADGQERLARERDAYGLAATELCRQLRVENKTRAALIERILARAWALVDESLPTLHAYARAKATASVQRDAITNELASSEAAASALRERNALTDISLWTARRKHAACEVALFDERKVRTV